jgi:hypothetical protein
VIERMDCRWDHGFIANQDGYLEERVKLQQELEQLTPVADDDLAQAADLLEHFADHWAAAAENRKEQQRLIQLIVARVWVRGDRVVALSLRPNFHLTVGLDSTKPTEIKVSFEEDSEDIVHRRGRRDSNPRSSA